MDDALLRAISPATIIAPHQDDETLGCGGLIARLAALSLRPRVAYLTDGAASHRGSPTWPRARLAAARRSEALRALSILGVPAADVTFLDWPDASPWPPESRAYAATLHRALQWLSGFGARSLFAPWEGEAHCDHAAAARLALDLAREIALAPRIFSYLVWAWRDVCASSWGEAVMWRLDCEQSIPQRRRALACHRTQTTGLIADAESGFSIPPELAALAGRPSEYFMEWA
jgi:LmbE family N-acetylglucosaminyl deacetylase